MTTHRYERHSDCGAVCGHFSPGDYFAPNGDGNVTCPDCLNVQRNRAATRVVAGAGKMRGIAYDFVITDEVRSPTTHAFTNARDGSESECGEWSEGDQLFYAGHGAGEIARFYLDGHFTCRACLSVYPQAEAIVLEETRKTAQALRETTQGRVIDNSMAPKWGPWTDACGTETKYSVERHEDEMHDAMRRWYERRLASIDARLERERNTPRPTHLHALGAMCSHHCPNDHVTADVDKATCWHCLRQYEMREAEGGRGIVDVPGVPQRVAVAVGYDDPTGDDIAADVGPRWRR